MHYFIDGYNLMFRIVRAGGDLQKQRQEIVQNLEAKVHALDLNVTLVFDAQYQPEESTRSHLLSLEIIFTNAGETADEFILHALKDAPKPHLYTVVTSDRELAYRAKRRHACAQSVEEFMSWLNRRWKNKKKDFKSAKKQLPSLLVKNDQGRDVATNGPASGPASFTPSYPQESSSPEECFNFYLNTFEKSYVVLQEDRLAKKTAKKAAKKLAKKTR